MRRPDTTLFRFLATPGDAAVDGSTIQAGSVIEWIDKTAYACAVGWSSGACVTAYVGNVSFSRAIAPGELVEVRAWILHTGRTSIHINVAVSSADPRTGAFAPATSCILVCVAVDGEGRPIPTLQWSARTVRELELSAGAEERIRARAAIHEETKRQKHSDGGAAPKLVMRFLASPNVVNLGGKAHGGTVMRWIDDSARTLATQWNGSDAVAVYSMHEHSRVERS